METNPLEKVLKLRELSSQAWARATILHKELEDAAFSATDGIVDASKWVESVKAAREIDAQLDNARADLLKFTTHYQEGVELVDSLAVKLDTAQIELEHSYTDYQRGILAAIASGKIALEEAVESVKKQVLQNGVSVGGAFRIKSKVERTVSCANLSALPPELVKTDIDKDKALEFIKDNPDGANRLGLVLSERTSTSCSFYQDSLPSRKKGNLKPPVTNEVS